MLDYFKRRQPIERRTGCEVSLGYVPGWFVHGGRPPWVKSGRFQDCIFAITFIIIFSGRLFLSFIISSNRSSLMCHCWSSNTNRSWQILRFSLAPTTSLVPDYSLLGFLKIGTFFKNSIKKQLTTWTAMST